MEEDKRIELKRKRERKHNGKTVKNRTVMERERCRKWLKDKIKSIEKREREIGTKAGG